MGKYFGTDGIRGPYGAAHMCPSFAYRLGCALGAYLDSVGPEKPLYAVVGRDTRASGELLSDALIAGMNRHSIHVNDAGVIPTPAVARAVIDQSADIGIAVTASHNPFTDNGIKLFDRAGCKLDELEEAKIEKLIDQQGPAPAQLAPPKAYPLDACAFYINYMRSLLDQHCLKGWKIVLDTANGATYQTSPEVFRRWGAELFLIGDAPNGENINSGVGSECPDLLARAVLEQHADIGIAHDGDGDRLVVCDEKGSIVDGDVLLALLGSYAVRWGALGADTLVATVHSNLGLDRALEKAGGRVERVDVGDRNVAARMRELGSNIGGESSGHIIFSDFATTGDGLLAAVKIIELMQKTGKRLSELSSEVPLYPQLSMNLRVAEKRPFDQLSEIQLGIRAVEQLFGTNGRVLVRYSGTEEKLRLLVEGSDSLLVEQAMEQLIAAARKDLNVIDS
jgi:phosphoglucosamine mutase